MEQVSEYFPVIGIDIPSGLGNMSVLKICFEKYSTCAVLESTVPKKRVQEVVTESILRACPCAYEDPSTQLRG